MTELQTAVDTMMSLILAGGADAAKDLVKGQVLAGAAAVSRAWRALFGEAPDAYPLADRVAREPGNLEQAEALRALVTRVLTEHPELAQGLSVQVRTGDIQAAGGSVAAAVIHGSPITITNGR